MAQKSLKDSLLRGIALLGLIVILVLGAWGIILLASHLPSFLGGVSDSISGLFTRGEAPADEEVVDDTEEEVPTVVTPAKPTKPAAPATPSTPSYVYTPAPVAAVQLYGLPDLRTSIMSVTPAGNRTVVQFVVENAGTNIAYAGWTFNAVLPLNPQYTYTAPQQRALNPGDKIVYTLTFDRGYNYGSTYNYDYNYNRYDERYDDCDAKYQRWDLDEWENWYEDVFDRNLGSRDNWDEYDWETWYDDFCDDRDTNDRYDYNYYTQYYPYPTNNRALMIVVDPQGRVYEQNEYNNSATWNLNIW